MQRPALSPLDAKRKIYSVRTPHGAVTLRLRLCPDGYVSGFERAAVTHALAGIADVGALFAHPRRMNEVCDAVYDVEFVGDVRMIRTPEGLAPAPFADWGELDPSDLSAGIADFFLSVGEKMKTLSSSSLTTAAQAATTRIFSSLESAALAMTGSTGPSSRLQHPSPTPTLSTAHDQSTQ